MITEYVKVKVITDWGKKCRYMGEVTVTECTRTGSCQCHGPDVRPSVPADEEHVQ